MKTTLAITLLAFCILSCTTKKENIEKRENLPNIIHIFTDDLGYGDIACFGATDIKTPNIDRIAKEGIKFNDFYSASSVCSPSRAGLLTGRYPQRMGINTVFYPESFTGMPENEITIPELLKEKGYSTGMVGKWHLGHRQKYLPIQQGFDSYFGIPYSHDMASIVYMRDNDVVDYHVDMTQITKRYTKEALDFLDKNKDKPFFLYLAHSMPHVPLYASKEFLGTSERGLYGDVIQELDWSVGKVLEKLNQLGLLANTLVIFSSDNGPWLAMEDYGGSAGELRDGKMYTFEGGMRVPTVALWKGKIPAGIESNKMASQMDWFPTFANLAGISLPKNISIDGNDLTEVLFNKGNRKDSTYLFLNGGILEAYRKGRWKVKKPFSGFEGAFWKNASPKHDSLLIDLVNDPGEKENLFSKHPELARQLFKEMEEEYKNLGNLPPDLIVKTPADCSHYNYLEEKRKNQ